MGPTRSIISFDTDDFILYHIHLLCNKYFLLPLDTEEKQYNVVSVISFSESKLVITTNHLMNLYVQVCTGGDFH